MLFADSTAVMDGRQVFTARSPQKDVRSRCSSNTFAFQPFTSPSDSSFLCAGKSRKTRALSLSGENCITAGFACALKAWLFLQTQGRDGLASTAWSQPLRGAGHAQLTPRARPQIRPQIPLPYCLTPHSVGTRSSMKPLRAMPLPTAMGLPSINIGNPRTFMHSR